MFFYAYWRYACAPRCIWRGRMFAVCNISYLGSQSCNKVWCKLLLSTFGCKSAIEWKAGSTNSLAAYAIARLSGVALCKGLATAPQVVKKDRAYWVIRRGIEW